MKLKDLFNVSTNKANNQKVLTLKKKILKTTGLSSDDLLNMKVKPKRLKW